MPHQCTNCGRTFDDGSKEMLSGCPDCGGNKFQFAPTTAAAANRSTGTPPLDRPSPSPVSNPPVSPIRPTIPARRTRPPNLRASRRAPRRRFAIGCPGGSSDASDSAEPSPRGRRFRRPLSIRDSIGVSTRDFIRSLHPVIRIHPRSRTNPGPRAGDPTPPNRTPRRRESSPTGRRRRGDPRTDPAHRASRRTRSPSMSSTFERATRRSNHDDRRREHGAGRRPQ